MCQRYENVVTCIENENALGHLESALEELNSRTKKREAREVEGLAEV